MKIVLLSASKTSSQVGPSRAKRNNDKTLENAAVELAYKVLGSRFAPSNTKKRANHPGPNGSGIHASRKGKKKIRGGVQTVGKGLSYIPQILAILTKLI